MGFVESSKPNKVNPSSNNLIRPWGGALLYVTEYSVAVMDALTFFDSHKNPRWKLTGIFLFSILTPTSSVWNIKVSSLSRNQFLGNFGVSSKLSFVASLKSTFEPLLS